jgi:hypothetical protein
LNPIADLRVEGDTVVALSGGRIIKANLDGSGKIESMDPGLEPKERYEMRHLVLGPSGDIWMGGGNRLYHINPAENSIKAVDEITLAFKEISLLALTSPGKLYVAGGNLLAVLDGGAWTLRQLPFTISGGVEAQDRVYFTAGDRGVATIDGDDIREYPHPLDRVAPYDQGEYVPLSIANAGDELWVLWTGPNSYLSVLRSSDEWDIYTFPAALTGLPQKLFSARGEIYMQTETGFFVVRKGEQEGTRLSPVSPTRKAVALTYKVPGMDIYAESAPRFVNVKPPGGQPVARYPLLPPEDKIEIDKDRERSLVPFEFKNRSAMTVMRSSGDLIVAGTETLGIVVLRPTGSIENEIFLYDAKPFLPFSSVLDGNRVLYPLAGGEAGIFQNGAIRTSMSVGSRPREKVLAMQQVGDDAYAMSLIPGEEVVAVYKLQDGHFYSILERVVDLATGIGSIGGFAVSQDGTYWFTIRSYGEGQEMGAAELRPDMGELVYNGAVPVPADLAVTIPNGLSSIQMRADGTVFLGGMDGLVKILPDRSVRCFKEPEGLVGDFVTDMVIDRNQRVWMLTVEGLGYMDSDELVFPFDPPYRDSAVACLGLGSDGSALLVDENGLKKYDGTAWKLLGAQSEIAGKPVRDVQADGLGNIWIVTDRAISIFREM